MRTIYNNTFFRIQSFYNFARYDILSDDTQTHKHPLQGI